MFERNTSAGTKRQFSASPSPLSTSPARFTASSSSPSPLKKARTLAEIKAQMKAKRAAAGGRLEFKFASIFNGALHAKLIAIYGMGYIVKGVVPVQVFNPCLVPR